ncbi:MAG: T9SS type A sorting domain-containing protein [Bacteroidales bacterium]|nr:T9SS type A sorting domain-containing protein [Bacteroidales bacterium]MCF8351517.1 T9SS type A sorting domain-containing protein [Bacteroidales bacterium]MCF8376508.1 T9SS type A sorting domain-containing protein [Bacteroidales bacterium]
MLSYHQLYTEIERPDSGGQPNPIIIFPNPAAEFTIIQYRLTEPSLVSIKIFDQTGRHIETVCESSYQPTGIRRVKWNAKETASGIYFCLVNINEQVYTVKIIHK